MALSLLPNRGDLDKLPQTTKQQDQYELLPIFTPKRNFSSRSNLGPKLVEYFSSCSSSQGIHLWGPFSQKPERLLRHIEVFAVLHYSQVTRLLPFLSLQTKNHIVAKEM